MLSVITVVVVLLATYLPAHQLAEFQSGLEAKASSYGRLVSKQVESAVAFNDKETAREIFDSVAQDADVVSLTLFSSENQVLGAQGVMTPALRVKVGDPAERGLFVESDRVAIISPVVSREGPTGTLVLELSTRRVLESGAEVKRHALALGLVALALGAVGAFAIARSLARRLAAIAEAAGVIAAGDLNHAPVDESGARDEIATMAAAFNAMLRRIRELVSEIRDAAEHEQQRLEGLVRERTSELDARNDDMRRVLDNVGEGFLTLDPECVMSAERSAILESWFGKATSTSFVSYMAQVDPAFAAQFEVCWVDVIEDVLPMEVTLAQLPKRSSSGGRHFAFDYRPILSAERKIERVLVVISDVTAVLERARGEMAEREVTRLFSRLIHDRSGFLDFFSEAHALVQDIVAADTASEQLARSLHTLKGNAAFFGLESVGALCHSLEDRLSDAGRVTPEEVGALAARWSELTAKVRTLVGEGADRIEIDDGEYRQVLEAIDGGAARSEIRQRILTWKLEPTEICLDRVAERARALAARLDKAPINVKIESNHLRLKPDQWSEFWAAAVHVIRNAVDHGLESPEERARSNKSGPPTLWLRTRLTGEHFSIEFADDGRGIDWARVATKARALGLPAETHDELVAALFYPGLSTRDVVTSVSGRGVGLGSVLEACRKLGGRAEVESTAGAGSTFRFIWPARSIELAASVPPVCASPDRRFSVELAAQATG